MTAPTPIEKKRQLGNPSKRALPDITSTHAIAPLALPPETLGEVGLAAWHEIHSAAPWLGESDRESLALYCDKVERRAEMVEKLQNTDFVLLTDKGYAYANPLVGMISTIETEMTKLLSLIGLTPADRSRLGLAEVKAASTLEKLRQAKAGK